ncbi:hypothetical protein V6Z98_010220 [Aspergillus fumigatus]
MPPAGHAGIRRGRRPCACRCKCPRRRRAALRCRKGARAPANWSPLAPPVSVWVSLDPVSVPGARRPTGHPRCLRVCRSASVCPWRAPLPAGGRPAQGAPANWSPCRPPARRPPAAPTRPANWPPRARLRASPLLPPPRPPRPPRPPFVALARATLCSPRGRAPTGPPAPLNRLPSTGTPRAPPAALLLHIPTDLARPIIVRANVPGSERRSGGRPTCAGRPRAARAAMCPSQLVTALRHQAAAARGSPRPSRPANWRESMEVEIPRGPAVTGAPPRLRRKVSGPPSKRPALPGPLMGGVCQQI